MTPEERKKAIREALAVLRDDIQNLRDECAMKITPHLLAFETNMYSEYDIYEAIESLAKIDADSFFETVGFELMHMCEDIRECFAYENQGGKQS